jgi:hypothetical protein
MAAQTNIPVICYDMQAVSRFFRSCALAIAIQHTTRSEWQTYRDSKVLNAVYKVLFWKEPPGLVEVRTGAHADIERRTDELHEKFLLAFIRRLAEQGPASAHRHIEEIAGLRTYAREAVRDVFAQAASINSEVIGTTQRAITDLARIKLGAQVGVAVLGSVAGIAFVSAAASGATAGAGLTILGIEAGTTGTGFAVAGAGHSITHSLIKTWEDAPTAQVAGVVWETGKAAASEIGGHVAGQQLEYALQGAAKSRHIIRSAQGEIDKYAARLAQEGLKKKAAAKATNVVAARTAQIGVQKAALEKFGQAATLAARVGKAIPVLFAAWDIWDAVGDYRETTDPKR